MQVARGCEIHIIIRIIILRTIIIQMSILLRLAFYKPLKDAEEDA